MITWGGEPPTETPVSDTKATHTPGPWRSGITGEVMRGYSQPFGVSGLGGRTLVAGVFGDVRGGEAVAQANARLIAAAPDYHVHASALAMLCLQSERYAEDVEFREQVDAVMAISIKAEGR